MTDDWQFILAAAIGVTMSAGLVVGLREYFWLSRNKRLDRCAKREMRVSLAHLPLTGASSFALAPVWAVIYLAAEGFAPTSLPLSLITVLLALFLADFSYYWEHRCAHKVGLLWAVYHGVHHGSSALTIATAYRVSFLNQLLAPAFYLPWVLVGFDPIMVIAMQLFVFHYQAWVHTEMIGRLPLLDEWLNTPANHRMHHSRSNEHKDRNFGAVLMIWDRLFGTYVSPEVNLQYGVEAQFSPRSLLHSFLFPWRQMVHRPPNAD